MKVSDYIADFLISQGITDCFGYPGGSVTNLLDSMYKRNDRIKAHVTYHEQGAAFAACGYAVTTGKIGMAYSTGGPGCTNLITGMGHAYYDSIPVLFITGNVNTYESKGDLGIRQRGFQESDNIAAALPFTKYAAYVEAPEKIRYYLEKACSIAMSGRKGPVLLDLPMDVQRAQIDPDKLEGYHEEPVQISTYCSIGDFAQTVENELKKSQRPCLLLGNGINENDAKCKIRSFIDTWGLPYVTSMIAFDVLGFHENNFGFLGAYGTRAANFIAAKSDLIISIGSRMDIRQVGAKRDRFAPDAKIIRVDIDENELRYKVHENEMSFCIDANEAIQCLLNITPQRRYPEWLSVCNEIKESLQSIDNSAPNSFIYALGNMIPAGAVITTDVGQNQVWVAQSLKVKEGQKVLFSGGFGSMGHALPAAIGAYYGSGKKEPVFCFCGDGGLQMNIQELQYVVRESLPIKIIVFNNNALGMIRHFQEMYFESVFFQTKPEGGYTAPDFTKIAGAYGIRSIAVDEPEDVSICSDMLKDNEAALIEVRYFDNTYITPKLEFGKPNQDQEPLLDRKLFDRLMSL